MKDIYVGLKPHIVERFKVFHEENPKIYSLFLEFSLAALGSGRKNYGAKCIAERVRWHVAIETRGDDFKICNNHISCYARLLMQQHASLEGFFRTKQKRGEDEAGSTYHHDTDHHVRDL